MEPTIYDHRYPFVLCWLGVPLALMAGIAAYYAWYSWLVLRMWG